MEHEFAQQVTDTVNSILEGVHTAIPGKILSYNPGKCQASVRPVMKYKTPDGESISYPDIDGVPVVFPQYKSQKIAMAFPIYPKDDCLLIIAEQSLDYWMYGQETSTNLRFDLSNAICIPGMFSGGSYISQQAQKYEKIVIGWGEDTENDARIWMRDHEIVLKANKDNWIRIDKDGMHQHLTIIDSWPNPLPE